MNEPTNRTETLVVAPNSSAEDESFMKDILIGLGMAYWGDMSGVHISSSTEQAISLISRLGAKIHILLINGSIDSIDGGLDNAINIAMAGSRQSISRIIILSKNRLTDAELSCITEAGATHMNNKTNDLPRLIANELSRLVEIRFD